MYVLEYVSDCGKLTISLYAVHPVIYGDEVNTILREYHFGIHPHLEIVAAQAGHILDDHPLDLARLDVGKHPLEARTVERRR